MGLGDGHELELGDEWQIPLQHDRVLESQDEVRGLNGQVVLVGSLDEPQHLPDFVDEVPMDLDVAQVLLDQLD